MDAHSQSQHADNTTEVPNDPGWVFQHFYKKTYIYLNTFPFEKKKHHSRAPRLLLLLNTRAAEEYSFFGTRLTTFFSLSTNFQTSPAGTRKKNHSRKRLSAIEGVILCVFVCWMDVEEMSSGGEVNIFFLLSTREVLLKKKKNSSPISEGWKRNNQRIGKKFHISKKKCETATSIPFGVRKKTRVQWAWF